MLFESKNAKHLPFPIDDICPTWMFVLIGLGNRQSSPRTFPLDVLRLREVEAAGVTLAVTPLIIRGDGDKNERRNEEVEAVNKLIDEEKKVTNKEDHLLDDEMYNINTGGVKTVRWVSTRALENDGGRTADVSDKNC